MKTEKEEEKSTIDPGWNVDDLSILTWLTGAIYTSAEHGMCYPTLRNKQTGGEMYQTRPPITVRRSYLRR